MNENLAIVISRTFELQSQMHSQQGGCFFVGVTKDLASLEDRLNKGWRYNAASVRKNYTSPPLGFCTDWKIIKTFALIKHIKPLRHPDFHAAFDVPQLSIPIGNRLVEIDKAIYPELNLFELPKNGLEQVFCLKKGDWESVLSDDTGVGSDTDIADEKWDECHHQADELRMHISQPIIISKVTSILKNNGCII